MTAANSLLTALAEPDRRQLESWLLDFDQNWQKGALAEQVRRLPASGQALRLAGLIEMIKIDIEKQWQLGRRLLVESYLQAYPELGGQDRVPADLLQAEFEVRQQFGVSADLGDFVRRFPAQGHHLAQLLKQGGTTTHPESLPDRKTAPPVQPPTPASPPDQGAPSRLQPRASSVPVAAPPAIAAAAVDPPPALGGAVPEQFGRYRILRRLGQGGMGSVFLAQDTQLDRQVALKVPHFIGAETQLRERFFREARAAATLDHPNLCPVFDVGEIDGKPFLTMAYVKGQLLSDLIASGQPISERTAAVLVRQLALALHEAHQKGVIHRDLKPANIMINQRHRPVILDFGLARRENVADARLTGSGVLLGTPAYMPPEQINGDLSAMGPGCDVYSLGVILYELLAGSPPFRGPGLAVLAQALADLPPALALRRPGVDPRLEEICLKAMAKKPADRYASMAELAGALAEYLRSGAPPAPARPPASGPAPNPKSAARASPAVPKRRQRRPGWPWLAGAGAAMLIFGVVFYLATNEGSIRIELPDPTARVDIRVDNDTVTLATPERSIRLRAGTHHLVVTGDDFETHGESFSVLRGKETVVRVTLVPKQPPTKTGPEPPRSPAREPPTAPIAPAATGLGLASFRDLPGHQGQVHAVAFSGDGKRAITGSQDKTAGVWDVASGERLARLMGHEDAVTCVALAADGKLALTGSADRTVRLWQAETGRELYRLDGHKGMVRAVAFAPDGRRGASASEDHSIRLWNLEKGTQERMLTGHLNQVASVAFSPLGDTLLSGGWDNSVRLWDAQSGAPIREFVGHTGWVQAVAFAPDGRKAASGSGGGMIGPTYHGAADRSVRVWDVATGKEEKRITGDWGGIATLAFLPNGQQLLFSEWMPFRGDRWLILWDLASARVLSRYQDPKDWAPIVGMAVSPDSRHVLIGRAFFADNNARLLRLVPLRPLAPGTREALAVAAIDRAGGMVERDLADPAQPFVAATFHGVPIQPELLDHLTAFPDIRRLILTDLTLNEAKLRFLKQLKKIDFLSLDGSTFADADLKQLADLQQLRILSLNKTPLTSAGLVQLKGLTTLQELHIHDTAINDTGLEPLRSLTRLRVLGIGKSQITAAGVETLKTMLPNIQIRN